MVYTIAAYHDIAHHIDAENHEVKSAQILKKDKHLRHFFTDEEIQVMQEAIEDHRASSQNIPRNIYGKIVATADRNTKIEQPFKRTFQYRKKHHKEDSLDKIIEESRLHLKEKYGKEGYATKKIYFKDEEYEKYLQTIEKLVNDKKLFRKEYIKINQINEHEFELERVRKLCQEVANIAKIYDVEFFFVTEGASACHVIKNEAVHHARKEHEKWEVQNGYNPKEDWSKEE